MIGQTISHYKILEKLGEGGMGVVYKAQDLKLDRFVALKFLPPNLITSHDETARFQQEAKAISSLNHPNVATIFDLGEGENQRFLVLEYLPGGTLKTKVKDLQASGRELPLTQVVDYGLQIAEGLAHAHRHSIIHRDVKTDNIISTEEGKVKITDFGLSKFRGGAHVTKTGTTVGTAAYMSPEQVRGEEVDHRSDLFSLGVVLYELATGHLPFRGEHEAALSYSIVNEDPLPIKSLRPAIPSTLENLIYRCLEKERDRRFQTGEEIAVELRKIQQEFSTPVTVSSKSSKLPWVVTAAVVILALIALYFFFPSKPIPVEDKSIAVLPFADMSPAKDQEYFCDGMADELINALTKLGGLHVAARTSAFQFKGKNVDVRTIGDRLNVSTVLEGSVRKAGNTLRITAQLVNVSDGYHLWSETYEEQLKDVFAIQENISRSIVEALKIKLVGEVETPVVKRYTDDLEAYNLYLKGRYHWNKRTEDGLKKSLEYFQQAIERDPTYALAYAGMADSYTVLVDWNFLPPHEAHPRARAAARKALEIESTLAEAHNSLAYVRYIYDWDWVGAETEFKRALELNPNYATAHQWYGEYLTAMERFDEARAEIKRAEELDPLSLIINAVHGWLLYYEGRYDEALEQGLKTLEMDPKFYPAQLCILWCYRQQGKQEEAIEQWKEVATLEGASSDQVAALDNGFAKSGMKGAWQWQLDRLEKASKRRYIPSSDFALAYARLGENDKAFEWLEKAYEERLPWNVFLKVNPVWGSLREDPRFTALLRKVGFEE